MFPPLAPDLHLYYTKRRDVRLIKRGIMSSKIKSEIRCVTPEMAKAWLGQNTNNRTVRGAVVDRYAQAMKEGSWIATHQGIAFDIDGRLVDGQHRLLAIVKSGVSVDMMITFNLDVKAYGGMDQGAARNAADLLGGNARIAEVSNLAARIIAGTSKPPFDVLERVHELIGPTATDLVTGTSMSKFFSSAPMKLAATVMILLGEDKVYVQDLYARLCRGDVNDLPPIAQALVRLQLRSKINSVNKLECLALGLIVFAKRNSNMRQMRNVEPLGAVQFVRESLLAKLKN